MQRGNDDDYDYGDDNDKSNKQKLKMQDMIMSMLQKMIWRFMMLKIRMSRARDKIMISSMMHTNMSQEPHYVKFTRNIPFTRNAGKNARTWPVKLQCIMSQEPLHAQIYKNNTFSQNWKRKTSREPALSKCTSTCRKSRCKQNLKQKRTNPRLSPESEHKHRLDKTGSFQRSIRNWVLKHAN